MAISLTFRDDETEHTVSLLEANDADLETIMVLLVRPLLLGISFPREEVDAHIWPPDEEE